LLRHLVTRAEQHPVGKAMPQDRHPSAGA
jgi:hypothetical protein